MNVEKQWIKCSLEITFRSFLLEKCPIYRLKLDRMQTRVHGNRWRHNGVTLHGARSSWNKWSSILYHFMLLNFYQYLFWFFFSWFFFLVCYHGQQLQVAPNQGQVQSCPVSGWASDRRYYCEHFWSFAERLIGVTCLRGYNQREKKRASGNSI